MQGVAGAAVALDEGRGQAGAAAIGEQVRPGADENPGTPNEYAVRGIPTMLLFKDGKLLDTKVGALPKGALKDWIAGNLA